MFVSSCVACRHARAAGYDGCQTHNQARARWVAGGPATVVVEHHHHTPAVVVVEDYDAPGTLIVDSSGHLAENLGGGIGVDLVNGDLTVGGVDTGISFGGGGDW